MAVRPDASACSPPSSRRPGAGGTPQGSGDGHRAACCRPQADAGRACLLEGEGERPFLRMNSNGYLGLALQPEVIAAEEEAVRAFGAGPQAVRFISGTFAPHVELERAARRLPRPRGGHDLQLGLRGGDGRSCRR